MSAQVTLAELWVYPVKSLAGTRADRVRVDDRGFAGDRRFMVVDGEDRFVTQRAVPRMALVHPRLEPESLRLEHAAKEPLELPIDAPGPTREVRVWDDRCEAIDAGDEVAAWLSEAIGQRARLVRMPESTRRPADPRHARPGDLVSFADGFPFLLVNESSLDALNERLAEPVDVRRFRPNLVVRGAAPWAEDGFRELSSASLRFHVRKPCGRCAIVNVDPDRGTRGTEPLATLASFRTREGSVLFGQNLVHDGEGELRAGELLDVVDARV